MSSLEKTFVHDLLKEGVRTSGRQFNEMRHAEIAFGDAYGHVELRMGRTRLVAQVSASVTKPRPQRPLDGLLLITTDVSSLASPKFQNGRVSPEEIVVTRLIEKAVRRSNALDLESLCITAGKRCWMIRVDVHYLDYDAGLVDASCLGVLAALLHFRRPDTSIDGDRAVIHSIDDRPPVPLGILHVPICVTFSFFENDIVLVDVDANEQAVRLGYMTITINKDRELCQVKKAGRTPLSADRIMEYCENAHALAKSLTDQIFTLLKQDFEQRNRGNLGFDPAENDR